MFVGASPFSVMECAFRISRFYCLSGKKLPEFSGCLYEWKATYPIILDGDHFFVYE